MITNMSVRSVVDEPDASPSKSEQTRAQIVDAACSLIGDYGYEGVTAAALVERAGISKGGLYHHFSHLDDVIIEAYQKTAAELFSGLRNTEPASVDEYLEQIEHLIFKKLFADQRTMRIMHELLPKAMYDPVFVERRQMMMETGHDIMSEGFSSSFKSKVKKSELKNILNAVTVYLTGMAIQYQLSGDLSETRKTWRWFRATMRRQYSD